MAGEIELSCKSILSVTSEGGEEKECNKEIKIKVQNNRKKEGAKVDGLLTATKM